LHRVRCIFLEGLMEPPENPITIPGIPAGIRTQYLPNIAPTGSFACSWYRQGTVSPELMLPAFQADHSVLCPPVLVAWCYVNHWRGCSSTEPTAIRDRVSALHYTPRACNNTGCVPFTEQTAP
jgi:hypothetical protein